MKRTPSRILSAAALTGLIAVTGATVGQAHEDDTPTYEEFKASTYQDEDGQFIVNGDEPVGKEASLRAFYDEMVAPQTESNELIVNTVYGRDDVWSSSQVGNLTYCVSDAFGSDKSRIVDAMEAGGNQWESATSAINFQHDTSQDGSCNTSNDNVVFSIEPTSGASYIARAFFPSSSKSERNVLVNTDQIFTSGWSAENVLAHELGHVLGFRHEHTRPEAGTCFEDNNWRPLTPYDSASIMHYPQCNGSSEDLSMSAQDREGVASVYPS